MPYEIMHGPYQGDLCSAEKPRGPKARYPLRDMYIGDYILVPRAEETMLWRSARNARYNHGLKVQVTLTADGQYWHVVRTA